MEIKFILNGTKKIFTGDRDISLLKYLREDEGIKSVRDGCSGQAFCGACMVEMNKKPALSCVTKMKNVEGKEINTLDGFPEEVKKTIADAFINRGAVQCGFCSPGLLTRTKILLDENPNPSRKEIVDALKFNFCRCTGYKKIIEAVEMASELLAGKQKIDFENSGRVGTSLPKYGAFERATGQAMFTDDIDLPGMLFSALKFSDHPRAKIIRIDTKKAENLKGVTRVFTWRDIPGERFNGLIFNDWPLMVAEGEITSYTGDVIAGVVADSEETARSGAAVIEVEYEVLKPVTDTDEALKNKIKVHKKGNLLETSKIVRGGDIDEILKNSAYLSEGRYETQRIEHAFLEVECGVAKPFKKSGVELFSQGQGVYEDRRQIARLLDLDESLIKVNQVSSGGAFGGKEDMTVQGHVSLYSYILKMPVKLKLSREESFRMHPKRHALIMDYRLGCDKSGKLTALKARITGDTGAYASVGTKVLERAAGHAAGAYFIPAVDIEAKTLYTNNVPCGAMRGFGVNQVTFAIEGCIDDLCMKGGFDRWEFRFENALDRGLMNSTGQILGDETGVKATLLAVKDEFYKNRYTGIACGIKNTGIGNGMTDFSEVKIYIESEKKVILMHGWTEMGQGVNTVAIQVLSTETGIPPEIIEVRVNTEDGAVAGMTTSSRGTSLIGNAIIDASKKINEDMKGKNLSELSGKEYYGRWSFEESTEPGSRGKVITHYSYGYATQLAVVNDSGYLVKIVAAHDGGKVINPTLFEGQVEGAVHMGIGYALLENFPVKEGHIVFRKLRELGILKIKDLPEIEVIPVEVGDNLGPYGAKGIGEIGLVPTAAAIANAFTQFDGKQRKRLPLDFPSGNK